MRREGVNPQPGTPEAVAREILTGAESIITEELKKGLRVTRKADGTPLTQIDTRINELALEHIGKSFSGDAVYAEEGNGGEGTSGYTWVIDPIDGTRALEMGLPMYTVCIARVAPDGQPDFSYVFNPSTGDLYEASGETAATKNGAVLSVMKNAETLSGKQVYMSSRMPAAAIQADELSVRLTAAGAERVATHSLAFGVMLVAEGKAVAAISGVSEPYELASVKSIVESAGGVVTDLTGKVIERCDVTLHGFIAAANQAVLDEIIELCRGGTCANPEQIIRQYVPGAHNIQPVKSGYVNDVYIVDETYVFRFPKSDDWRQVLLFETEVLKKLEGHTTATVPFVQHVEPDGSYAVFSYIAGVHRNSAEIRAMSSDAKRSFAGSMATFLVELNNAVPRGWMKKRLVSLPVERKDDAAYYAELLELGRKNDNPYFELYNAQYGELVSAHGEVFSSEEIVIHGDLHSGNFIFDESDKLAGIFDFGDCMLNTVYVELRQIYHFGDDVLEMMITALYGRFGAVSKDAVRQLAITHELSILMRLGSSEETPYDKDRSDIAKRLLKGWGILK